MVLPVNPEAAGWIEGGAQTSDGRPVTRTSVRVSLETPLAWWSIPLPWRERSRESRLRSLYGSGSYLPLDHNGTFRVGPLMPGKYSVRVEPVSWLKEPRDEALRTAVDLTLKGGETERVSIEVEPFAVAMPEAE